MLHRVEFRAVGGLRYQPNIFWDLQSPGHVPASLIDQHDDEIVFKIFRNFLEKQVHHIRVSIGKNERSHFTQSSANRCVHIQKGAYYLPRSFGPHTFWSPTISTIADSAESAFILRHDSYWPCVVWISFVQDCRDMVGEVFLKSSCS